MLLGDVVELLRGASGEAMDIAEFVLRAIGRRLLRDASLVIVPGNHDGDLITPWLHANGVPPGSTPRSPAMPPRSSRA